MQTILPDLLVGLIQLRLTKGMGRNLNVSYRGSINGMNSCKFFKRALGLCDSNEIIQSSSQVPCFMSQARLCMVENKLFRSVCVFFFFFFHTYISSHKKLALSFFVLYVSRVTRILQLTVVSS